MALPPALQIDQPFSDLATELGARQDRNRWAGLVLSALLKMADQFKQDGFSVFQSRCDKFDVSRDRAVRVLQGGRSIDGVARGVSDRGALRLQGPDGLVELHGGEISLRLR